MGSGTRPPRPGKRIIPTCSRTTGPLERNSRRYVHCRYVHYVHSPWARRALALQLHARLSRCGPGAAHGAVKQERLSNNPKALGSAPPAPSARASRCAHLGARTPRARSRTQTCRARTHHTGTATPSSPRPITDRVSIRGRLLFCRAVGRGRGVSEALIEARTTPKSSVVVRTRGFSSIKRAPLDQPTSDTHEPTPSGRSAGRA